MSQKWRCPMPIVEPFFSYLILFIISNWEWIQLGQYLIELKELQTSVLSSIIIWGGGRIEGGHKWLQRVHTSTTSYFKGNNHVHCEQAKTNPINLQNLVSFKRCRCELHSNFQIPKFGGLILVLFWQLLLCDNVKHECTFVL